MKGIQINPATGDLYIENGLLSIGNTREQNAQLILSAEKGEFKEYPTLGVGLHKYINSVGRDQEMIREIKVQLSLDGMSDAVVEVIDGRLQVRV